jgi:hypothetical protein
MLDNMATMDSFAMLVIGSDGRIKNARFVTSRFGGWEFIPNALYLSLINSGRIQPNTWKVPFLFGSWKTSKETN